MQLNNLARNALRIVATLTLIAVAAPAMAQSATDRLGVPGPVDFSGTDYTLSWTAQPSATYYKQEYLPAGQQVESYEEMFIIEAVTAGTTAEDAAASQIAMLDGRKGSDPVVNYDLIRNETTGEVILDFLISDSSSGTMIVEWNAYRYAPLGDGVALYAISRRGYGEDGAKAFLTALKDWRPGTINELATFEAPAITPQ